MRQNVTLSIQGIQHYDGQEQDTIELVTAGYLEELENGCWQVGYDETELTGLVGTQTIFLVEPNRVTLSRAGAVQSKMVFEEGVSHDSLYQLDFGAMRICVNTKKVRWNLSAEGGSIQVFYSINVEEALAGSVEYRVTVEPNGEAECQ